ncbi:MAG: Asp-tRNA(Asn)/Glu-tRNA(Gln) amidotransferase subunit GatA [Nitrososphaeraceae archaeon]
MNKLCTLSAEEITCGIRNQDFTIEDYIIQLLERIKDIDDVIRSYITINDKDALRTAQKLDRKVKNQESLGPLAGIAIGVKDNICTKGIRTTCASKLLQDYSPPYDATVIHRLKQCDAIIIGKVNLDEFAMGSTTEFGSYGPTYNPWNRDCVVGGSSGGSAASVAASECTVSLGSDTGGSIRCPASFCSVVGFKPTYGLVSRFGLISYANSLEQIGPLGRTVSDVVMVMNAIAGFDENDNTTVSENRARFELASHVKRPVRIGLIKELVNGVDPAISKLVYSSMDQLSAADCICEEVSLKSVDYALASYYTIAMAEASSNLARYDNLRYGFDSNPEGYEWNSYFSKIRNNFGEEVKRRIMIGSHVLLSGYSARYYLKAQKVRSILRREIKELYKHVDVLISPTMPVLPFKIGETIDDPIKRYLMDVNTVIANLAGTPAISLPAGFSDGLPIGLQLMTDEMQEQLLFDVSKLYEGIAGISRRPDI